MFLIHLIVNWLLTALALWLVARLLSGFEVRDFRTAMVAAAVIALVNFFFGWFFHLLALPLNILTFGLFSGLFSFVINTFLLWLAALITPGFRIRGLVPALLGALLLTAIAWVLRAVVFA